MSVIAITQNTFQSVTSQPGIVFIDCWASWCGPCKMFRPIYDKAAEAHPDITFGSIDTEAEVALAGQLGISAIPTIMAFRDGILVFSQAGALRAPDFEKLVAKVQELDMTKVRADIAAQKN